MACRRGMQRRRMSRNLEVVKVDQVLARSARMQNMAETLFRRGRTNSIGRRFMLVGVGWAVLGLDVFVVSQYHARDTIIPLILFLCFDFRSICCRLILQDENNTNRVGSLNLKSRVEETVRTSGVEGVLRVD